MKNEINKRISREFGERLDKIKGMRIESGLDKLKNGSFASDSRLTKAIVNDPVCKINWLEIEKRLVKIPRKEDILK
jgi:hypothetical protein